MTASKSKNDKAWEIIFEEDRILDVIASDVRQTNYYVSAANYLGLVNRAKGKEYDVNYVLSDLGQFIIST
jgi:hypothetical protein